jgi:hypothetical protein
MAQNGSFYLLLLDVVGLVQTFDGAVEPANPER